MNIIDEKDLMTDILNSGFAKDINVYIGDENEKSELKLFNSSGRVMRVIKYVFKTEKLKNVIMFKLPEFPKGISYATEEFKKVVEENNIKGFKFKEL